MAGRRHVRSTIVMASLLLTATVWPGAMLGARAAAASIAPPTVTGPVTGGNGSPSVASTTFDLGSVGYEQSEFFLSGTASSYASSAPLTSNGKWTVTPSATAGYVTRAVVYRPINSHKFNGTVVVEWLNVSGGLDAAPDWLLAHNQLIREGFAWVGVSAQKVGADATKRADPVRYASLSHPGDSFSYDIFSQAGEAVRKDAAVMLSGLKPRKVIAIGESQSASRLVTYIDAVEPLAHVYNGFLVHSEAGSGAPLSQSPQPSVGTPNPTKLRNDLRVPVFEFETESDVGFSNLTDRQPDTSRFRLWEVAGSSHYDSYGLTIAATDTGDGQGAVLDLAAMENPTAVPFPGVTCSQPINTGGTHWVLQAAMHWLNRWVTSGQAPPVAHRLKTLSASPVVFAHDADGNVLGGVRSPQVDAPVATLGGSGNGGTSFCFLFGTTVPFSATQIAALYPTHRAFVSRWVRATRHAVSAGFLLPPDAAELNHSARVSQVGNH